MLHVWFHVLIHLVRLGPPNLHNQAVADHFLSCWDTYYYSYLQVVNDQTVTNAGYILNAFSLMSAFIAPFTGL